MYPVRNNLEVQYAVDMIMNTGFTITQENPYAQTNVDNLINSSKFTDCEFRCDCGAFIGQELIGQVCPRCHTEITLHSLNFRYTGWIDLGKHKIIQCEYYTMLRRVLGYNVLRMILGDYKKDKPIKYNENDTEYEEKLKTKKSGRPSPDSFATITKKIPKNKLVFQGIGHDGFYERFEEIMAECAPKNNPETAILLANKDSVFTSKIPIYSTAFRPVTKTSETLFYPKINKWFAMMVAIYCKLDYMVLPEQVIQALNAIQNYYIEACHYLIKSEVSKKEGFIRTEIVGGTFSFSARSVIILDVSLRTDEIDIPFEMALEAFHYKMTHMLAVQNHWTLEQSYLFIEKYHRHPLVLAALDAIIADEQWVFILREPTINLASIALCKIRSYKFDDDTISLPPEPLGGYNADFDGDQLNLCFLPKEVVQYFEPFHYSCMTDYVNQKFKLDWKEWLSISAGLMTQ